VQPTARGRSTRAMAPQADHNGSKPVPRSLAHPVQTVRTKRRRRSPRQALGVLAGRGEAGGRAGPTCDHGGPAGRDLRRPPARCPRSGAISLYGETDAGIRSLNPPTILSTTRLPNDGKRRPWGPPVAGGRLAQDRRRPPGRLENAPRARLPSPSPRGALGCPVEAGPPSSRRPRPLGAVPRRSRRSPRLPPALRRPSTRVSPR